jgi:hypothetical protein
MILSSPEQEKARDGPGKGAEQLDSSDAKKRGRGQTHPVGTDDDKGGGGEQKDYGRSPAKILRNLARDTATKQSR